MKKTKSKKHPLNNSEIAAFCNQYAMLIKSGIAPLEVTDILLEDTKDVSGKEILDELKNYLYQGEYFHVALQMTGVFPSYVISMVKIGEESGNLDEVLSSLAFFYEKQESIADSFRSAIMYPFIMIIMMFIIITVLIVKVMPIFSQVFAQLGTSMNAFSENLLSIGTVIERFSYVLVIILVALFALFIVATKSSGNKKINKIFGKIFPPIKKLYNNIAVSRFSYGMALAISSGMDTYSSLNLLKSIVENNDVSNKIEKCKNEIKEGESFPDALKKSEIYLNVYSKMIMVGFRSGSMDDIFRKIGDIYQAKADKKIQNLLSILEPTLVIILSVIVGMILLSVILPLMGIMSSIG